MTLAQLVNTAFLATGAVVLVLSARRASLLLRLRRSTPYARVWRQLAGLMLFFVVGYLVALVTVLVGRLDLLAAITGLVFLAGAVFVLVVTIASHRTLLALLGTSLSQKQIGQILDALGDAIVLVDDDGTIRMANRRLGELVGRPTPELLGLPASEVLGLDMPNARTHDSANLPQVSERELLAGAGRIPVSLAVAQTDAQIGTVCALRDVREERQRQQRLDSAVRVAEEILRVRKEFMALVAIELHDPLWALGSLRRAADAAASPSDFAAVGARITAACEGLERAVQGLAEVARLGGSVAGTRAFSPTQLLADVAAELVPQATRLDVDVSIEVEPGVPAVYFAQDAQIREALRLLAMRAVDRAVAGRVLLSVGPVPGDNTSHQLLFAVQDTGPSLSSSVSDVPLDSLDGGHTPGHVDLDLATCRLLALSLGGRLSISNTANRTVTAYLSVQGGPASTTNLPNLHAWTEPGEQRAPVVATPALGALAPRRPISVDMPSDLRGKVLVVEDNVATRELLVQQLRLAGHEVAAVGTIADGAARVDSFGPDVVLLDVLLPDGTGIDLLGLLRTRGALDRLSVLMISTLEETASIAACLEGGAEDYLPKRVSPVVLRARLAACLEKQRLRERARQQLTLLEAESRRANNLLRILLPDAIADELQSAGAIAPRRHERVAVMFADIVGFTAYCDRHVPEEVLAELQQLFTRFEALAREHGVQKIKTIGDSFMGAVGLFTDDPRPALRCVTLGRAMVAAIADHPAGWRLRVGVHAGPVVGGVVGTERFQYDIWGDTVNTAQRVESAGREGQVCVSATVRAQIEPDYAVQPLGLVDVKGKGSLELYVVEDRG